MQIRYAEERDTDDILRLLVQVNMVHHTIRPDLFKGPATKYNAHELAQKLGDDDEPIFVYADDEDRLLGYIFCQTEVTKEFLAKLHLEDDPIFVCVDDEDRLLGYIFCMTETVEESPLRTGIRTLYIDDLCVDETSRGQHVGQMLYRHVLDYARSKDYYNVTLHVWGGNDGALRFYRAMGMQDQFTCLEQIL